MKLIEIIIIALSLAMDAFAVSVCKGLSMKEINYKKGIIIALYFGIFQSIMPLLGYIFCHYISGTDKIDHYIVFILLFIIGISMIKESLENKVLSDKIDIKNMLILSIATSIDAWAIGITFSLLSVDIIHSSIIIGVITFILSFIGVIFGNKIGNKYGSKAEMIGGIILILMGLEILLEHLGYF